MAGATPAPMNHRKLGTEGLTVSALGLGCMGMSQSYGPADEGESEATLRRAVELGITFFDTANAYGLGHNERLVGRVLAEHRADVQIATKFGIAGRRDGRMVVDGRPEYAKACCDESLQRLGIETIDLYYLHRVDPTVPIEETVGAMGELVAAGKVRYLGLSEASAGTIRRAHATHPVSALQSEWSLFNREPEETVLPTLRELGIGFVPFSPLGRGFLTGEITTPDDFGPDDFRRTNPRFQGENFARNLQLVARVTEMAAGRGCPPGQLALAWLVAQGDDVVPIPGTKRRRYLDENVGALDVTLSADELSTIDELLPIGSAAGPRYEDMSHLDQSS
jgi:aryl-alcohol dehydrogenase-like predicted oxidoreductase